MPRKKGFNKYKIEGDIGYFYIINKKDEKFTVMVDSEDIPKLIELDQSWHIRWDKKSNNNYINATYHYKDEQGNWKQTTIRLHAVLTGAKNGETVDHINHDTLDNRKANLRILTKDENNLHRKGANSNNKTGVRNVHWINKEHCYKVQFSINYKPYVWKFLESQFKEACEFAEKKRKELYGDIGA